MLATLPVKVITASAVPSPLLKVKPVVPESVIAPLLAVSVTSTGLAAMSRSAMLIGLPLPLENTRLVSSLVLCGAGMLLTGASLTALTVMFTVSLSESAPPLPVLP